MGTEAPSTWLDVANVVFFILFTALVSIGAFTTIRRAIRFWRKGQKPPLLLLRDVVARLSLALPFATILFVRALGQLSIIDAESLRSNPWYVLPTGGFAVFGAALYVYFELVVIERDDEYPGTDH